jgi:hypothetical protein
MDEEFIVYYIYPIWINHQKYSSLINIRKGLRIEYLSRKTNIIIRFGEFRLFELGVHYFERLLVSIIL